MKTNFIMMKKHLVLLSVLLLFAAVANGQNYKKFYRAGNDFMKMGKYQDAVAQFTKAIEVEPSEADLYIARGNAYEILGDIKSAYTDYEKANGFSPRDTETLIKLGIISNRMDNYRQALGYLNRAAKIEKRNNKIYPEKIESLMGLEEWDKALKASDTALILKEEPRIY